MQILILYLVYHWLTSLWIENSSSPFMVESLEGWREELEKRDLEEGYLVTLDPISEWEKENPQFLP